MKSGLLVIIFATLFSPIAVFGDGGCGAAHGIHTRNTYFNPDITLEKFLNQCESKSINEGYSSWDIRVEEIGQHTNYSCHAYHCGRCYQPYVLNSISGNCEAHCALGEAWEPVEEYCVAPPEEQDCETQGQNPIDFIKGRKYRSEAVIKSGGRYPFSFTYFYNNHRNQEKTPAGSGISVVSADRYLAATKAPKTGSEYQQLFTSLGVPSNSGFYLSSQHYGSVNQYWRHGYDEVLQIHGESYIYRPAKGHGVHFLGFGASAGYPHIRLQTLSSSEEAYTGYKLINSKSGEVKKFNSDGRLMKIERRSHDVLMLTYDSQNRLNRITNSEGAFIELAYQELATDSIYSVISTSHSYAVSVTNDRGESAQITWGSSYQGKVAKFHLITRVTEATSSLARSARTFEYNDPRWPASITDQYFVEDLNDGKKKQTLHFEYDEQGRAIYSGTVAQGGSDSVEYVDEFTRVVTNALGKKAVYEFADISGARRLKRVTGEPTQNCVKSEVEYVYDTAGNVEQKVKNGSTTQYAYDSQNREISRTEAAGTPDARTITTEYHPTLNKPVKITEPGKVTTMTYDAEGRLLSNTTQSTVAP